MREINRVHKNRQGNTNKFHGSLELDGTEIIVKFPVEIMNESEKKKVRYKTYDLKYKKKRFNRRKLKK